MLFAELEKVAPELGVEVGDVSTGRRELFVTAFSDPDFFHLVKEIADQLNPIKGWLVVRLSRLLKYLPIKSTPEGRDALSA